MLFNGAKSIGVNNDTRLTDSLPVTASNDYLRQTYLNSSCQIEVYADKLVRILYISSSLDLEIE